MRRLWEEGMALQQEEGLAHWSANLLGIEMAEPWVDFESKKADSMAARWVDGSGQQSGVQEDVGLVWLWGK